jgi:putative hydrolase of the HAD superfamily
MIKAIIFDLGNTLISQKDGNPFPFALDILVELKRKYKLALLSNAQPSTNLEKIEELLRDAQLDGIFEEIIVSTEVGMAKPNPKIFKIVLDKLSVTPEEAVMIGNTISTDIFGGNRVGMRTVLFQPSESYQKSSWEHPDHTVNSLKDLFELL